LIKTQGQILIPVKDVNLIYAGLFIGLALAMLFVFLKSKSQVGSSADPLAEAEVYLAYGRKNKLLKFLKKQN
jgi:hypothetical protein